MLLIASIISYALQDIPPILSSVSLFISSVVSSVDVSDLLTFFTLLTLQPANHIAITNIAVINRLIFCPLLYFHFSPSIKPNYMFFRKHLHDNMYFH